MRFLLSASVAAIGISFALGSAAMAQDAAQQPAPDTAETDSPAAEQPRGEGEKEIIIVTARRRSEQLQSTPIAVTPFDQRKLDERQISTFGDLQFNVPNLTFTKTNFSGSSISIRAIGTTVITSSGDSGVAIHVNEAPIVFANIFSTELYDVQAFEVLRGPQGTLFGRNATGGTVNLITSRPVNDLTGYIEARVGDYNDEMFRGALNVPITDNFWVRGAFIKL
ncbi:MAG: TonB-dependent receptor plug domain-containing protein, partial [Sphingorhabdus sp.]